MNKQKQTIRKRLEQIASQVEIPDAQTVLLKAAGRENPSGSVPQPGYGRNRKIFYLSAAALVCAAALCALFLLPMKETMPAAQTAPIPADPSVVRETEPPQKKQPEEASSWYISFDVNPGIELTVGENGRIAMARGVNGEGQTLLNALNLEGRLAEDAASAIVDALVSAGYIDPAQRTNTMLIGGLKNGDLLARVTQAVTAELGQQQARTFVIEQTITDEAAARAVADKYGVTLGKAQYILDLSRQDGQFDLEHLAAAEITYIFSTWNTVIDTLEAGEYDEYGQLVLYPLEHPVELMNAALVWEQFTEEQRQTLREQYTQEELDILYAPSSQVFTVPDFKGMTASQCKALAKERGFVVEIVYSDVAYPGGGIDLNTLPKGKCYYQDPVAGWRTVTTGVVTVFVQRDDPTHLLHHLMWKTEEEIRQTVAGWNRSDVTLKFKYRDFSEKDPEGVYYEGKAYEYDADVNYGNNSRKTLVTIWIQRYPEGWEAPADPTPTPDPMITDDPAPEATTDPVITDDPAPEATTDPVITDDPAPEATTDPVITDAPVPEDTPENIPDEPKDLNPDPEPDSIYESAEEETGP